MVLFSFGRLLLRRMALRKSVAITAAALCLLGVCGVVYMLQERGAGGSGRTRTVVVVGTCMYILYSSCDISESTLVYMLQSL